MDDHDRLLYETAARLSDASRPKSASNHRAYNSDWRHFERWCQENGLNSLPAKPSSIAQYVDYLTRPGDGTKPSKPATISRRLCSINAAHKAAQLGSPATMNQSQLSETLHDLRQAFATQRQVRKRPITPARIARILDSLDGSIAAVRNRALLLIGVAGALGNSELAAIRIESLKWNEKGLAIDLPHAIDDGETQTVEIPFATDNQPCAVKALKDWLTIANLQEGKVFRSLALSGSFAKESIQIRSAGWYRAWYESRRYTLRSHTAGIHFANVLLERTPATCRHPRNYPNVR